MEHAELAQLIQLITNYWRGREPINQGFSSSCHQLADLLYTALPRNQRRRVQQAPDVHIVLIQTTLAGLLLREPAARILAQTLLGTVQPRRRNAQSSLGLVVTGSNNQITVAQQISSLTQTMTSPQQNVVPAPQETGPSQQNELIFRLQLLPHGDKMEVRALQTPFSGEPRARTALPFGEAALSVVLRLLGAYIAGDEAFSDDEVSMLEQLGLQQSQPLEQLTEAIGRRLYDKLFAGDIHPAFQATLDQARRQHIPVHVHLCFDEDAVSLARTPWELIHDGRRSLLVTREVHLTRSITYAQTPTTLRLAHPLRLLHIAPRPSNLLPLPESDVDQIRTQLSADQPSHTLDISELHPPTFQRLLDYIDDSSIDILHYYGHGGFGRRCGRCAGLNAAQYGICALCGAKISDVMPEGHLAFEDDQGRVDWLCATRLGQALAGCAIQVAVLMACSSGVAHGATLFSGVGPVLMQAGIPAVVATQHTVTVASAQRFTASFYRAFLPSLHVATAARAARQRLESTIEWYIPTIYLRHTA